MTEEENYDAGNESYDSGSNEENQGSFDSGSSEFSIPDEYKDKGWTKFFDGKTGDELKSELFKSYDNSQSMIGKRVEDFLANNNLKDLSNYEEIKKNLSNQLTPEYNVPENSADYDLKSLLQDENGNQIYSTEDGSLEHFQDQFKELGLSKEQGQKVVKSYMNYQIQEFQKFTNADELENNINAMFKDNSQQRTTCESLIREFLPPQDQKFIQQVMPNNVVEMFYKVAKGMVDKYDYKESRNPQSQSTMRMTNAEKDAEYDRIATELEQLSHRPHSAQEKQTLVNQMLALYK